MKLPTKLLSFTTSKTGAVKANHEDLLLALGQNNCFRYPSQAVSCKSVHLQVVLKVRLLSSLVLSLKIKDLEARLSYYNC